MLARDVMTGQVLSVTADITLQQTAKLLVENGIGGVPVVDGDGIPIGMVTERDLIAVDTDGEQQAGREWWLTRLAEGEPLSPQFLAHIDRPERTAGDVMAAPVVTVTETTELSEIARLFINQRITRCPVLQDGRMVGIVSRADLVRRMAEEPAQSPTVCRRRGLLSEAVASLDEHFNRPHPSTEPAAKTEPSGEVTADAFSAMVEAFGNQKIHQHDEARRVAAEQRVALVECLIDRHLEGDAWQDILRRAQAAAQAGQKELLLLRFPCELCSDGGRAINGPLPDWPETLRGEAAEIYLHWERDLKPKGFHLLAQVIDFPGGIPGDIGLTLSWGG